MNESSSQEAMTESFARVFGNYGKVALYAARRGSRDTEAIASEVMAIAWQRMDQLAGREALPWLIATARNLLFDEYRARRRVVPMSPESIEVLDLREMPDFDVETLDPDIDRALAQLAPADRESLLLVAWDELTPGEAADALGIGATTFRMRLMRARRRFKVAYAENTAGSDLTNRFALEEKS